MQLANYTTPASNTAAGTMSQADYTTFHAVTFPASGTLVASSGGSVAFTVSGNSTYTLPASGTTLLASNGSGASLTGITNVTVGLGNVSNQAQLPLTGGTLTGVLGGTTFNFSGGAAANLSGGLISGTWFNGGTGTTTRPMFLIEPAGTTSSSWQTTGTGLGINCPSTFTGYAFEIQKNGSSLFHVDYNGELLINCPSTYAGNAFQIQRNGSSLFNVDSGGGVVTTNAFLGTLKTNYVESNTSNLVVQFFGRNLSAAQVVEQHCYGTYTNPSGTMILMELTPTISTSGTGGSSVLKVAPTYTNNNGSGPQLVYDFGTSAGSLLTLSSTNVNTWADGATWAGGTSTGTKIGTTTTQKWGFWGASPIAQPTVTGSKASGAALISLLSRLSTMGLIVDSSTT